MNRENPEQIIVQGIIGTGYDFLARAGNLNAFLGISLDKPTSEKHLGMYIEWVMGHARHCPIVIDDIEMLHNYMVFKNMTEDESRALALQRGEDLAATISGLVAKIIYPFSQLSYIQEHPEDHKAHAIWVRRSSEGLVKARLLMPLNKAYYEDEQFREAIQRQIDQSIGKRVEAWKMRVTSEEYERGRERLARFVLKETAVTLGLVERQYGVELYAGLPIQVVVDLYNPTANKYPKLKEELSIKGSYGHVSLGVSKVGP